MSTVFPASIDSFANPTTTKVNGVDFVKASHINDLQDSVRAMQQCMVGSGLSMGIKSNYFIPESASFLQAVEIIDQTLNGIQSSLTSHHDMMAISDPIQHHANVIEVASGSGATFADIPQRRLQIVLEVIRAEITRILNGETVRGKNLAEIYVKRDGPATFLDTLSVDGNSLLKGDVDFGSSPANQARFSGSITVLGDSRLGDIIASGSLISVPNNGKIGLLNNQNYSYVLFGDSRVEIGSKKDIVLRLDRDALINPSSLTSYFTVLNSSDNSIFSLSDVGNASIPGLFGSGELKTIAGLSIGENEEAKILENSIRTTHSSMLIGVDADSLSSLHKVNFNKNGYTGEDPSNDDLMLQISDTAIVSGTSYLKPGLTENGEFGFKFFSRNQTGEFHGYFVPFRQLKTVIPNVVFTVNRDTSVNVGTVQVAYVTTSGFFVECDSVTTGPVLLRGTYEA